MASSEGGGDDQGSGWLQVKKKHRSTSQFSLHGWVGGFAGKQGSRNLRSQAMTSVKSENSKRSGQNIKTSIFSIVNDPSTIGSSSFVLCEDEKTKQGNDKNINTLNMECPKSPTSTAGELEHLDHIADADQKHPKNLSVRYKIKWGDLDDEILNVHQKAFVGADRNMTQIEDNLLVPGKAEKGSGSSCMLAIQSKGNEYVPLELQPMPIEKDFIEYNCKELNEVSSDDVKTRNIIKTTCDQDDTMDISQRQFASPIGKNDCICNLSAKRNLPDESEECVNKVDDDIHTVSDEKIACRSVEEATITSVESSLSKVSGVLQCDGASTDAVLSQDPVSVTFGESGYCYPEATKVIDPVEVMKPSEVIDDIPKCQSVDIGVERTGESKERFRHRLWCFLFENLNRAIDELYLLCELECDLEQVRESILVLEEAASDFRELNSRVEEFEKVKKSTSHIAGAAALTMRSDHRRPHALSWEVRRMTNSPLKAEILSSSLEAFTKIQQERYMPHASDAGQLGSDYYNNYCSYKNSCETNGLGTEALNKVRDSMGKQRKQTGYSDSSHGNSNKEKRSADMSKCCSRLPNNESSAAFVSGKSKKDHPGVSFESDKLLPQKNKIFADNVNKNTLKSVEHLKKQAAFSEMEKDKRSGNPWKSMDAWKEKRNWKDILASPHCASSRFSHSPGISRRSAERARSLHDKLMSPDKRKKSALDLKKEAEEKHARAMRIRSELENERVQKLQRVSEKLNRVNEWQAVRSMKMREIIYDRHRRSESRHEAFLAQVVRRAGDESSKVNEVRFITSLNEENKKLILRQKLQDSELRRAEKIKVLKTKQKEDMAREEAVLERKRLIEAEKLQRLAETQRRKEEAQIRREEERKASTAAREAKAMEHIRRKEVRAKAQQEEAELLAQKLAERLRESEQRRKFYLEQIREKASMDFRDQSSPLLRRSVNKEGGRTTPISNFEDYQANSALLGSASLSTSTGEMDHLLKRRIKKIRQKLMALKYELPDPPVSSESAGIGYRTAQATARAKLGRWLQELQKLRQARKEGAANFGLIASEMMKFLDGRDAELQASRQAGLLDYVASALPACHSSKPEACQVTIYLLRLLRVVLSVQENRSYFLAQNLLPPIIPMLVAAIENYIKIVASLNVPSVANSNPTKSSSVNVHVISETLDGFLWTVAAVIGHGSSDDRQLKMQNGLLELVVAYKVIHRLRDLFALYDGRQVEGSPFPPSILLSVNLLAVLTSRYRDVSTLDWELLTSYKEDTLSSSVDLYSPLPHVPEEQPLGEFLREKENEDAISCFKSPDELVSISTKLKTAGVSEESPSYLRNDDKCGVSLKDEKSSTNKYSEQNNKKPVGLKQPMGFLLSAIAETGLVCLPSMLTAVLLQANNRSSSEQTHVLPSNFEEVATGVLKVLKNVAQIDMTFIQKMLARSDLKMEFFHVMSFILSHCSSKWGAATDQNGLLLLESLSLLGYFSFLHPENQAVLRWGKDRTILHKVTDLPFAFFSDPELMPVLASTLVAACFGCEQNKEVVQQELSIDMLLSLLKSCKNNLSAVSTISTSDNLSENESSESNQVETTQTSHRSNPRNTRVQSQKGSVSVSNRIVKMRNQRENKTLKLPEELGLKQNQSAAPPTFLASTLYSRFPESLIQKAEQFFSVEAPQF